MPFRACHPSGRTIHGWRVLAGERFRLACGGHSPPYGYLGLSVGCVGNDGGSTAATAIAVHFAAKGRVKMVHFG